MVSALHGLHVLDLSGSVAGQFCGRMLADYGADVTLVEPPVGTATRRAPPFHPSGGTAELLLFQHLNVGKSSITLDRRTASGRRLLLALAERSDVVVAGTDAERDAIAQAAPRCIVAQVSDFGDDGPYRDWRGTEMIHQALAGIMRRNGVSGREPLYGCGDRASYGAGVAAYIGVLAALFARARLDRGQLVSVDVAATTASMANPFVTQYFYSGLEEPRGGRRMPLGRALCRDGWVGYWLHVHLWHGFCELLGLAQLLDDPRFAVAKTRLDNWAELVALVQAHVTEWRVDDVLARLQSRKVVAARVFRLTELWNDCAHLRQRGYWETVDTPHGPRPMLGPQFRMSATPRTVRGGPPALGEANARIYGALGLEPDDIADGSI